MPKEQLLAIDVGTQSTRALIFDLQGNLLFKAQIPLPTYQAPKPGWAELDPGIFWESLCQACQQLWTTPGVDKGQIAGVAITTQRNVMINLDQQGNPLRPAIHWSDQRRTSGLPNVGGLWGVLFTISGMMDTIRYLQSEAKTNWIQKYQPEIWSQTAKVVLLSGYLTHRMTGKFIDSTGCQVAYLPFDYKNTLGLVSSTGNGRQFQLNLTSWSTWSLRLVCSGRSPARLRTKLVFPLDCR